MFEYHLCSTINGVLIKYTEICFKRPPAKKKKSKQKRQDLRLLNISPRDSTRLKPNAWWRWSDELRGKKWNPHMKASA